MSTEKREYRAHRNPYCIDCVWYERKFWIVDTPSGPVVAECLMKEDAERIASTLNACTGLADPEAAIKAAREALENAEIALRMYDQRVDAKLCADALALLNAKGER